MNYYQSTRLRNRILLTWVVPAQFMDTAAARFVALTRCLVSWHVPHVSAVCAWVPVM